MVRVEVRQLAVVEDLVQRGEPADVLDERVLLPRLVGTARLGEEVAEGRDVVGLGDDADRLLE